MAGRDPRVPFAAKAVAIFVTGYAMSPLDLIADFIPVLGYMDDVVIVPLGIADRSLFRQSRRSRHDHRHLVAALGMAVAEVKGRQVY